MLFEKNHRLLLFQENAILKLATWVWIGVFINTDILSQTYWVLRTKPQYVSGRRKCQQPLVFCFFLNAAQ